MFYLATLEFLIVTFGSYRGGAGLEEKNRFIFLHV